MRTGRLTSRLLLASVFAVAATGGFAPAPPDRGDLGLERRIADIRFENTAFADALENLKDLSGINLRVSWTVLENAGIDRSMPVTFRLRNVTARKILDTLLREAGAGTKLAYEIDEGIVTVTSQEEADKVLVTEVYDVRDLLFTPIDAGPPPEIQFQLDAVDSGGGGGSGSNLFPSAGGGANQEARTPEQQGTALAELIQSLIRPEIWNVSGGPASIRFWNGTLIVSAPRSVQALIGTPIPPTKR